jgi:methyl-accepting chemotaxis protein
VRPYRRRRFLIDKFQYRILFLHLVYFLALILIFSAAVFLPLIMQLESGALSFAERHAVAAQFLSLHARLWPAVVILFVLLSAHSVFVSHRIAGPLFRFRKVLRAVASGDLSVRLTLRKKDYLVKEAELVEEMIVALRNKIGSLQEHCSELDALVEEVKVAVENGSLEEARSKIESLRADTTQLLAAVDEFRTDEPQRTSSVAQDTAAPVGQRRAPNEA